jgi:peroxiredoxin
MRLLATAALLCICGAVVAGQLTGDPTPLKVGDQAPDFLLTSTAGAKVKLSDFKAKNPVVLAFFPAAFTGG